MIFKLFHHWLFFVFCHKKGIEPDEPTKHSNTAEFIDIMATVKLMFFAIFIDFL